MKSDSLGNLSLGKYIYCVYQSDVNLHVCRSKRKSDFAITFIDDDEMKFGLIDEFRDENSFTVIVLEHYSSLSPHIIQLHPIE